MALIYTTGTTIRIIATFTDYAAAGSTGILVTPTSPSAKVYDSNRNVLTTGSPVNDSTGVYHFDWTIPSDGTFYLEISGTVSSEMVLTRQTVIAKFSPL